MEGRGRKHTTTATQLIHHTTTKTDQYDPHRQVLKNFEYKRSLSQGNHRRLFPVSYFSLESVVLLTCLAASLLILPLILPPLPPPPFMLLLLPICILAVLMILAFMPSSSKDITYTKYV